VVTRILIRGVSLRNLCGGLARQILGRIKSFAVVRKAEVCLHYLFKSKVTLFARLLNILYNQN
jgi:hypothetical protein